MNGRAALLLKLIAALALLIGCVSQARAQDEDGGGIVVVSASAGNATLSDGNTYTGVVLVDSESLKVVSGTISDVGAISINGADLSVASATSEGTLTISSANTYTGSTIITAGTLSVNTGASNVISVLPAGTVISTSGTLSISSGVVTLSGASNYISMGTMSLTESGTLTFNMATGVYTSGSALAGSTIDTANLAPPTIPVLPTVAASPFQATSDILGPQPQAVPEPSGITLLLPAALVFFVLRRRIWRA